jgi:elongation factor G
MLLSHFRNFGILAHVDAGKTTCTERVLLYTGRIREPGEVHLGNTEMDWTPQERKHGITITAAVTTTYWAPDSGLNAGVKHRFNLIDTPGHVDFAVEVERSLRVLDGAIVLLDASNGVEPQTESVWRQANHHRVPRIVFVNKMDKVGASFASCLESLREGLGANALAVQLPLGEESEHRGIIDLLHRQALSFSDSGQTWQRVPIPDAEVPAVEKARAALVEACAEWDGSVLEAYLEGRASEVTAEALERALRIGTLEHEAVPVLCGSAYRNRGVQPLLDAVVSYLPSPVDAPKVGTPPADPNAPLCALAFKLMTEKRLGTVTFVRVYSGTLRAGTQVLDATTGKRERIGRLLLMHANSHVDLEEAPPGVIVGVVGLKDVRTGDTLCDEGHPLVLEAMHFPEPVVELVLEPKARADQERLSIALHKLALEDPSLKVSSDEETSQVLLKGMGELHLEIAVDKLHTDYGVEVTTGAPTVAYRETLARPAKATHRLKKQSGGPGQFAVVSLEVVPLPRGQGLKFVDASVGGGVPKEFRAAVEKGVRGALSRGVQFPLVDIEVRLLDGESHSHDSNALAFEIAGSLAFQQAAREAGTVVLEPVMAVEVLIPSASIGTVLGDLSARRGRVLGFEQRGPVQVVDARVPLAEMFGYVGSLRGRTEGRGSATMQLSHYDVAPAKK